jgi:hypothetical protein
VSSTELRRLRAIALKLPIQNIEQAHSDKDEIVWSLGIMADAADHAQAPRSTARPPRPQPAPEPIERMTVAEIQPGPRVIRHRLVPVVRRTPRRVLMDLREAA